MKKLPHTYVIIFALIILAAICTWIVPNGVGQSWQVFSAFFKGFQKTPAIIVFILIIGGAFWILNDTKAIDYGVSRFIVYSAKLEKNKFISCIGADNLFIVLIMIMFSLFGAIFGMSEETIAFAAIFVPLAIKMGYDSIVGICMCFLAAGLGFAGCLLNPFTLGIAQDIADIKMFSGLQYRLFIWAIITFVGISFVLYYANRIKRNPKLSPMYELDRYWREKATQNIEEQSFNGKVAKRELLILFLVIVSLIVGVTVFEWGFTQIAALFFFMAIACGVAAKKDANEIAQLFIAGCKDMLSAAMVVGLASGIIVILEDGKVIDYLLKEISLSLSDSNKLSSLSLMYVFQTLMNALITSGTAKAAMLMPIFRDISNMVGLSLQSTVTAFHIGDGFTNLITPTSGVLIAVLGVARIPYVKWVKFIWKFILAMVVLGWLLLLPTIFFSLPDF